LILCLDEQLLVAVAVEVLAAEDQPARGRLHPAAHPDPAALVEEDEVLLPDGQGDGASAPIVRADQADRDRLRVCPGAATRPGPSWAAVDAVERRDLHARAPVGDVDEDDLRPAVAVEVPGDEGGGLAVLALLAEPMAEGPVPEDPALAQRDGLHVVG